MEHELGVIAEIGLAGNECGRIVMVLDLRNLLYVKGVVDNDDLLNLNYLRFSLLFAEKKQAQKHYKGRNQCPHPPGDALLGFGRNVAVEVLQTETAFLAAAGSLLEIGHHNAVLLGPGHQTIETGLGPHRDHGYLLAVTHLEKFVFGLEEAVPVGCGTLVLRVHEIFLDTGIGVQLIRESLLYVFQLGLRIHHHIGVHNPQSRAILSLAIDTHAGSGDIGLRSLDLRFVLFLLRFGCFCFRFFNGCGRCSLFQEFGQFCAKLLGVPFFVDLKTGGFGYFA